MTSYASVLLYLTYLLFQAFSYKGINVLKKHILTLMRFSQNWTECYPNCYWMNAWWDCLLVGIYQKEKGLCYILPWTPVLTAVWRVVERHCHYQLLRIVGLPSNIPRAQMQWVSKVPRAMAEKNPLTDTLHPTPSYRMNTPRVGNGGPAICFNKFLTRAFWCILKLRILDKGSVHSVHSPPPSLPMHKNHRFQFNRSPRGWESGFQIIHKW